MVCFETYLGYCEKHPERGDDSFNIFDELMGIGVEQGVDMVILGGDLFHENKPSRWKILLQHFKELLRDFLSGQPR